MLGKWHNDLLELFEAKCKEDAPTAKSSKCASWTCTNITRVYIQKEVDLAIVYYGIAADKKTKQKKRRRRRNTKDSELRQ